MNVADYIDIQQVINLYGFAMDSQSWDLFEQIFTNDVHAYYSDNDQSEWHDLATFKADFAEAHAPLSATQHSMSGHLTNLKGNTAYCLTYGAWKLIRKGLDGGDLWEGTGWYDDVLVKTNLGWRIKKRVCRTFWWSGNTRAIETVEGARFRLPMESLRTERQAGRVMYFESLLQP